MTISSRVARSARRKNQTLDLFPSSVRDPKIEGLDLYTYVYICVRFELRFSTGQVTPKPDSLVQNRTPGNPTFLWAWGAPTLNFCLTPKG